MKIKTSELSGAALDWAVAKCEGFIMDCNSWLYEATLEEVATGSFKPSTDWSQGGPIIERENVTIVRADNDYIDGKYAPNWFAETDKWVGHSITSSYEGEYFDPCFMIDESGGYYGPTPLIAAMRCYVASKLGDTIEVPEEPI